ncbi:MAG: EF-P beta-lysylation protein EpmB [Cellvibrionaceae bacterium]|jgi:EF-P beta-lysylation protein EpmB
MIPRSHPSWQVDSTSSWQQQLQSAIEDPKILLENLNLDTALLPAAIQAASHFPLRVPRAFVARMEKGNPRDPLLRQVLPIDAELIASDGYHRDPVSEQGGQTTGLIQKYQGRALLIVSGHCAINCRYCFRRHFPYDQHRPNREQWLAVFNQLRQDSSIREIILSGGDPLVASDRHLSWLSEQLSSIPHIQRLRIHSRLPVVIPARLTDEFLKWLISSRLKPVLVLHINHPNEIDRELGLALQKLRTHKVTLLNQAVLLKGVNDCADVQTELSEKLFDIGILPYYLHIFDRVAGAAHFDLPLETARYLHAEMRKRLPGYLLPRLVQEVAGEHSKTHLFDY